MPNSEPEKLSLRSKFAVAEKIMEELAKMLEK